MDYKNHFLFLLDYNKWADGKVAKVLMNGGINDDKPLALFSHILNAEIILLARIKKTKLSDPFEVRALEENIKLSDSIYSDWKNFLISLEEKDFENIIEYINIKGEQVKAKIGDIFIHMINHSTYHRGQIASQVRSQGIEPPVTDFITYTRTKNNIIN